MPTVAEMIQSLLAHGMSADTIAQRLGKSTQAVHSWETGRVTSPHRRTREAIEALYRSVVGQAVVGQAVAGQAVAGGQADHGSHLSISQPCLAERSEPTLPVHPAFAATSTPEPVFDAAPPPDRHTSPPPRTDGEAFRFIHCADLHIDSPLHGLRKIDPRYAAWIRTATRQAFRRLVDMAIADDVQFVVIAGDLYDGDWKSADTGIFVSRQLTRLADAGIQVFAITGNHDALSVVTRSVSWPANARRFDATGGSFEIRDLDVVIHGRSFGDRYESTDFVAGYPPPRAGAFNLGLLHTSLAGAAGHATYAPCSSAQLAAIGYDYWALGHVHVPRVVQTSPHVVYSGNIQGRDIGEAGPRGCFVVTVDHQRRPTTHFVPLDDVRWERIDIAVNALEAETADDVVAAAITAIEARVPVDERLLACRVVLRGETPLHRRLIARRGSLREEVATAAGSQLERVCLEEVLVETSAPASTNAGDDGVPVRAISLIDDEFRRLEAASVDAVFEEAPELKKLFEDIRLLDSMRPGRREELLNAASWQALVAEAREVLGAELGRSVRGMEEAP